MIVHILSALLGGRSARVIAIAQMASEQSISLYIPETQIGDVVRFLHDELAVEKRH